MIPESWWGGAGEFPGVYRHTRCQGLHTGRSQGPNVHHSQRRRRRSSTVQAAPTDHTAQTRHIGPEPAAHLTLGPLEK